MSRDDVLGISNPSRDTFENGLLEICYATLSTK